MRPTTWPTAAAPAVDRSNRSGTSRTRITIDARRSWSRWSPAAGARPVTAAAMSAKSPY
jgi:hypothetical protein